METNFLEYRGFKIQVNIINDFEKESAYAFLNDVPMFGTFSHLDSLSAYEKMCLKIDNYYKTKK